MSYEQTWSVGGANDANPNPQDHEVVVLDTEQVVYRGTRAGCLRWIRQRPEAAFLYGLSCILPYDGRRWVSYTLNSR